MGTNPINECAAAIEHGFYAERNVREPAARFETAMNDPNRKL
jgi:hypothetical protein